jgi:RHS repeat-associated protein
MHGSIRAALGRGTRWAIAGASMTLLLGPVAAPARADSLHAISGNVTIGDGSAPPDGLAASGQEPTLWRFYGTSQTQPPFNFNLLKPDGTCCAPLAPAPGPMSGHIGLFPIDNQSSYTIRFTTQLLTWVKEYDFAYQTPVYLPRELYFRAAKVDLECNETTGCPATPQFTVHAKFGSLEGRVMYDDGTPAAGVLVRARDLSNRYADRTATTDAQGWYDFTVGFIEALLGPDLPSVNFAVQEVAYTNHWGIPVDGDGGGFEPEGSRTFSGSRGRKTWTILVGSVSQELEISGSQKQTLQVILPVGDVVEKSEGDPSDRPPDREQEPEPRDEDEGKTVDPEKAPEPKGGCESTGKPISVTTGNVFLDQTDAAIAGLRRTIVFQRSYNSAQARRGRGGLFGLGWRHSFEKRLVVVSPSVLRLDGENGTPRYFSDPDADQTFTGMLPRTERSRIVTQAGTYIRHFIRGGAEAYDAQGYLISQTDAAGHVTVFERDPYGTLSAIIDPNGRSLTIQGGSEGLVLSGPEGPIATYEVNSSLLRSVKYADGTGYRYSYSLGAQLLTVTDIEGRIIESHEYGLNGSEQVGITSEIADGREKLSFAYAPGQTTVTDARGHATVYNWAEIAGRRQVTSITGCSGCGGGGETQSWTYDTSGRVLTHTDALQHTTTFTYDASGNVASIQDPLNRTMAFTYTPEGRVATRTNPDLSTSTVVYGPTGATSVLRSLTESSTTSSSVTYDALGRPGTITDARGKVWNLTYTPAGDLHSIVDPLSRTTLFEYDSLGRRTRTTDPIGRVTEITYDVRGRVKRVLYPDGTSSSIDYDRAGRPSKLTDPRGRSTHYVYDTWGRLQRTIDPSGGATVYSYDLMSDLVALTDPKGQTTQFERDPFGRVLKTTAPDGSFESFTYDNAGRLVSRTDRKSVVTTFGYDDIGRLTGKTYSDGSPAVSYSYDAGSRLAAASNGADSLTWTYNLGGQLLSEASAQNASSLGYTHDAGGNRLSLSLDGSPIATYAYDDISRVQSITHGAGVFGFGYDLAGRRSTLSYPNGVVTTYQYDVLSRLTSLSSALGQVVVTSHGYVYDPAGNRTRKTTPEFVEDYRYDALDRLSGVDRSGPSATLARFGYDDAGNRVTAQAGAGVTTSSYDSRNQLLGAAAGGPLSIRGQVSEPSSVSVNGSPARLLADGIFEAEVPTVAGTNTFTVEAKDGTGNTRTSEFEVNVPAATVSYAYDANGNLISRTENGTQTTYEWDVENRLKRVLVGGAEVARFAYDPLGRRIEKTTPAGTWRYAYDGIDIVREIAPGGTTTYVHGPGIDEPLARETASGTTYYHADGLGSIVKMTDQAGAVTLTRQYDAWGNLELGASEAGYAFTGREWDPEIGLYYYRARYYDPRVGRFVSEDPIGFVGGQNFYRYVNDRPLDVIDPFGLFAPHVHYWITVEAAFAEGLGAAAAHQLALETKDVDFRDGEQLPGAEHHHAMRNPHETPQQASDRMQAYIRESLANGDLAAALHAIEDAQAAGHGDFEPYTGRLRDLPLTHGLDDFFPNEFRYYNAYERAREMIRTFKQRTAKCQ